MVSVARLGAIAVAALFTAVALAPLAVAAGPAPPPAAAPPAPPARIAEGAELTSFYFGKANDITPIPPVNETNGQSKIAPGVTVPRALLSIVGTWSVGVQEAMYLESLEGMSIWASSDAGATNVRFIVLVFIDSRQIASLSTDSKPTLSSSPAEFNLDPGSGNFPPQTVQPRQTLSFQLEYASSSPRGVGPSADSTFHYYGNVYRSRVDFVTNPFNLSIAEYHREGGHLNISTVVKDAFGVPPEDRELALVFTGPSASDPDHVKVVFVNDDRVNGTTYTWNWDWAGQGSVGSGVYTITLSAKYAGSDYNYTTSNSTQISFPKGEGDQGLLPGPDAGAALAALVVVAAGVALRAQGGRGGRKSR